MNKLLDKDSQNNNELNEVNNPKNLCVHDLIQKLRAKQKKQFIKHTIILFIIITFFGAISLLFYQRL